MSTAQPAYKIGLFVTCLVDLFRPGVGFAAIKLLEQAGCQVDVPPSQTCCGQPAHNAGDKSDAAAIAKQTIAAFEAYDYCVVPSGSCAAMIRHHYPQLLADDKDWERRANTLAEKTCELTSFLTEVIDVKKIDAKISGTLCYHDSCSGLRELSIHDQPRKLLAMIDGLTINELPDSDVCCGFGGTFCVKYPDISNTMVQKKAENIKASGATILSAGDLGCLMNMAGKLNREGTNIEVRHVAEILAGMTDIPPLGRN